MTDTLDKLIHHQGVTKLGIDLPGTWDLNIDNTSSSDVKFTNIKSSIRYGKLVKINYTNSDGSNGELSLKFIHEGCAIEFLQTIVDKTSPRHLALSRRAVELEARVLSEFDKTRIKPVVRMAV